MILPTMRELNASAKALAARMKPQPGTLVAIPRGGVLAALLLARHITPQPLVVTLPEVIGAKVTGVEVWDEHGTVWLVDDILATGVTATKAWHKLELHTIVDGVVALHSRLPSQDVPFQLVYGDLVPEGGWVTYPWEVTPDGTDEKPTDAVVRLIEYLGDDPNRPGLKETPKRVLRYLDEVREQAAAEFVATAFETVHDDLVVVSDIPFASLCEHHMMPFYGVAHVGYLPNTQLLGLSKTARMVNKAAAGLTVQEHLTRDVATQMSEALRTGHEDADVAVVTTAIHSCMVMRGVRAIGSRTSTSTMLGRFRDTREPLRQEFFALIQQGRAL